MLVILITFSAGDGSGLVRDYRSMLSRQGGLTLEIKCPCARKTWHEREVGIFLKWAYFRETTVYIYIIIAINDYLYSAALDLIFVQS